MYKRQVKSPIGAVPKQRATIEALGLKKMHKTVEMPDNGCLLYTSEEVSSEQFKQAGDDLTAQGMEKLIVDLRNNGGGVVQAAKEIADYLLPDGKTIVSLSLIHI